MAPGKRKRLAAGPPKVARRGSEAWGLGLGEGPARGAIRRQPSQSCRLSGACSRYVPRKLLRAGRLILVSQMRKLRQGGEVTCPRRGGSRTGSEGHAAPSP